MSGNSWELVLQDSKGELTVDTCALVTCNMTMLLEKCHVFRAGEVAQPLKARFTTRNMRNAIFIRGCMSEAKHGGAVVHTCYSSTGAVGRRIISSKSTLATQ